MPRSTLSGTLEPMPPRTHLISSTDRLNYRFMTTAPLYDVTARKAHQFVMVALIALGFVLGDRPGWIPVALAGAIMLVGRFWWPADVVREFVWRVAEPAGWLPRIERAEDHATRRVARVLGGAIWLISAAILLLGWSLLAWALTGLIAVMVVLDATL